MHLTDLLETLIILENDSNRKDLWSTLKESIPMVKRSSPVILNLDGELVPYYKEEEQAAFRNRESHPEWV